MRADLEALRESKGEVKEYKRIVMDSAMRLHLLNRESEEDADDV